MLRFCLCFLSFFYTVNSFSTKEKQEEEIKCYLCKETIIKIEKGITENKKEEDDEPNYTVKAPFASLSCIFDCNCNSYFLCENCCKNKKNCPKCKNNKKQSKKNTNNGYNGLSCEICFKPYIAIKLASCSYFYNCNCNGFICKKCYNQWTKKEEEEKEHKCPMCKAGNNHKGINYVITMDMLPIYAMGEIEDQKNCCQICTECIKDCFIDCI